MNIGLVLSGGMSKGAYQLGALKAIEKYIPREKIKYISCSSVGVINGYAFITNSMDHLETIWNNIHTTDARFFVNKMLRTNLLQHDIRELVIPEEPINTNFYCTLMDISNKSTSYQNLSSVAQKQIPLYLKAGIATPLYNRAIRINDVPYFDGSYVDSIPVYPLLKHNLDYIICISFDEAKQRFENTYLDNKVIRINFSSNVNMDKKYRISKNDTVEDMIKKGYDRADSILYSVLYNGLEDLEYIYKIVEYKNMNNPQRETNAFEDILTMLLNKIKKTFFKKRIL